MSRIEIEHAPAGSVAITAETPKHLPPRIWFQPSVHGASITLALSASEARAIARELNIAAYAITPDPQEKCGDAGSTFGGVVCEKPAGHDGPHTGRTPSRTLVTSWASERAS